MGVFRGGFVAGFRVSIGFRHGLGVEVDLGCWRRMWWVKCLVACRVGRLAAPVGRGRGLWRGGGFRASTVMWLAQRVAAAKTLDVSVRVVAGPERVFAAYFSPAVGRWFMGPGHHSRRLLQSPLGATVAVGPFADRRPAQPDSLPNVGCRPLVEHLGRFSLAQIADEPAADLAIGSQVNRPVHWPFAQRRDPARPATACAGSRAGS